MWCFTVVWRCASLQYLHGIYPEYIGIASRCQVSPVPPIFCFTRTSRCVHFFKSAVKLQDINFDKSSARIPNRICLSPSIKNTLGKKSVKSKISLMFYRFLPGALTIKCGHSSYESTSGEFTVIFFTTCAKCHNTYITFNLTNSLSELLSLFLFSICVTRKLIEKCCIL